jgi:sec-independent protein translocase protein TatB
MFDVGFSEIVMIAVVALIVIGPERLPKTARMLGHLFGRLQRYVNEVKADINREMELDELRKLQREVKGVASDLQQSMTSMATDVRSGMQNVERQLNDAASGTEPPPAQVGAASSSTTVTAPMIAGDTAAPDAGAPPPRQSSLPGFDQP